MGKQLHDISKVIKQHWSGGGFSIWQGEDESGAAVFRLCEIGKGAMDFDTLDAADAELRARAGCGMSKDMETRYEIRADNPDPAKAEEWAVFALAPNCHARRVAYTTDKAEAEAVLLGLRAAPDLYAALGNLLGACELVDEAYYAAIDAAMDAARAALSRAKGGV